MLDHIAALYQENRIMFMLLAAANVLLGVLLSRKAVLACSGRVAEAMGARKPAMSLYMRCSMAVEQSLAACEKKDRKEKYIQKGRRKRCGKPDTEGNMPLSCTFWPGMCYRR